MRYLEATEKAPQPKKRQLLFFRGSCLFFRYNQIIQSKAGGPDASEETEFYLESVYTAITNAFVKKIYRGNSSKPLYITSIGMEVAVAAEHISIEKATSYTDRNALTTKCVLHPRMTKEEWNHLTEP